MTKLIPDFRDVSEGSRSWRTRTRVCTSVIMTFWNEAFRDFNYLDPEDGGTNLVRKGGSYLTRAGRSISKDLNLRCNANQQSAHTSLYLQQNAHTSLYLQQNVHTLLYLQQCSPYCEYWNMQPALFAVHKRVFASINHTFINLRPFHMLEMTIRANNCFVQLCTSGDGSVRPEPCRRLCILTLWRQNYYFFFNFSALCI